MDERLTLNGNGVLVTRTERGYTVEFVRDEVVLVSYEVSALGIGQSFAMPGVEWVIPVVGAA